MARILFALLLLVAGNASGQFRMLPVSVSFKDLNFAPTAARLKAPPVFPVSTYDSPVLTVFRDSSKRYSNVGHFLYQRQLIEITDREVNAKLWITPLIDFSYGAELQDSNTRISQNTRGVRMEGSFGKRFFFTTSFYENQAFLPGYVSAYIRQRGEQYINPADSSYFTDNAVVPGSARTKPFKGTGFDYSYATGIVSFTATKKLDIHFGNQPLFVGSGHRSLLWSDNSFAFMNLRLRYRISSKWDIQVMRGQGLNLLRLPFRESAEARYEKKSMSFTTLYYSPTEKISIGLFEGGMWSRGDSVRQRNTDALFYLPFPGAASLQQQLNNRAFAVLGIDFSAFAGKHLVYGQFALSPAAGRNLSYQLGTRIFPFESPQVQLQLEYNHADADAGESGDTRLNYSSNNLSVAHPMGNSFDELLLRFTWQKNYWFAAVQANYFPRQSENATILMPVVKSDIQTSQRVINQSVEFGYRFNREYGFEVYGGFRYRYAKGTNTYERSWLSLGIRTMLNNHYYDF